MDIEHNEENKMNVENSSTGIFSKIKQMFGTKVDPEMTAQTAWLQSMYGSGFVDGIEARIKTKQDHIRHAIMSKFRFITPDPTHRINISNYSSFHCIIDVEEDLVAHISEIFEPFIQNGFTIINLSERIEEIADEHVYIISWRNAFK